MLLSDGAKVPLATVALSCEPRRVRKQTQCWLEAERCRVMVPMHSLFVALSFTSQVIASATSSQKVTETAARYTILGIHECHSDFMIYYLYFQSDDPFAGWKFDGLCRAGYRLMRTPEEYHQSKPDNLKAFNLQDFTSHSFFLRLYWVLNTVFCITPHKWTCQ